jgi:hypothetical protein
VGQWDLLTGRFSRLQGIKFRLQVYTPRKRRWARWLTLPNAGVSVSAYKLAV